jgi:hypothetical protein
MSESNIAVYLDTIATIKWNSENLQSFVSCKEILRCWLLIINESLSVFALDSFSFLQVTLHCFLMLQNCTL